MKKIILISLIMFTTVDVLNVNATSGACSDHGGVDCNYKSFTGNAICKDGWESSESLYSMIECKPENVCSKPTTKSCSDDYQRGLQLQAIRNGTAQFAPSILDGQIYACKNQQLQYIQELNSYNMCVSKLLHPIILPLSKSKILPNYNNTSSVQINNEKSICMNWQAKHGYVADGICCSDLKGVIIPFTQEYPQVCIIKNNLPTSIVKQNNIDKKNSTVQSLVSNDTTSIIQDKKSIEELQKHDENDSIKIPKSNSVKETKLLFFIKRLMFWKW